MKRTTVLLAVPALAGSLALTGCGSKDATTTAATTVAATTTTAAAPATTTACPTDNTRTFAKTRFVADVGLAAGTFHRWIYKPYQEGKFTKGADGRTVAIAKAVGVAALDAKLINNAYENVQADPTLCNAIGGPLGKLKDSVNAMKGQITSGDLSSVVATEAVLGNVLGTAQKQGLKIDETTDESLAK